MRSGMDRARVAKSLAVLLHPVTVGFVPSVYAAVEHEGGLTARLMGITVLVAALCVGLPSLSLLVAYWTGRTDDPFAVKRETRIYLYPASAVGLVAAFAVFTSLYPFPLARRMVVAAGLVTLGLAVGNRRTKVSIHTAANAAIAVAVGVTWGPAWAIPFALAVPTVAWSRVTTGHHTVAQTVAGGAIGAIGACLGVVASYYMPI